MNLRKIFKANTGSHGWSLLLLLTLALVMFAQDVLAQNYSISLRQRRMGNQIGVEVWVRRLSANAPRISNMSLGITYNTAVLQPASATSAPTYSYGATDSIHYDVNRTAPYESITSGFNAANGYNSLAAQAANDGTNYIYQLDVTASGALPFTGGLTVSNTGRGSFVGMLKFNIINNGALTNSTLTNIGLVTGTGIGQFTAQDTSGASLANTTTLTATSSMTVRGITILNPNGPSEAVNRNKTYASLSVAGYPIYFERSGLITPVVGREFGTNSLAYAVDYSTDNGTTWSSEVMRFAETRDAESSVTSANHKSGEISTTTGTTAGYIVTQGNGSQLPVVSVPGYGGVLRVIWSRDQYFVPRSEQARLRIMQLDTTGNNAAISSRGKTSTNPFDISDASFVLSRLFFLQLNGTNAYLRTRDNYSNSSQLTVEGWINLNSIQADPTAEPGIVCTGPAGQSTPTEGAFSLYLAQGRFPAFRVRESIGGAGRGENGGQYIATVVSPIALTATSDAIPISSAHSNNWVHVAGVVNNNAVSLYVNGELVATTTNTNTSDIRMATLNHPVWVGINPTGGLQAKNYLHAGIKEVKVWRVALTNAQIRQFSAGVVNPTTVPSGDVRNALELYYDFGGASSDLATAVVQNGTNPIAYFTNPSITANASEIAQETYPYRPDRAHLKITSPIAGSGISNLNNQTTAVRWVSYGVGDATTASSTDLAVEFSRDGGNQWAPAIDNSAPAGALLTNVDVENNVANWMPYRSATSAGAYNDLQNLYPTWNNYSKNVRLRVRGVASKGQTDISDVTGDFVVAPYFAARNTGNSVMAVPGSTSMNITGSAAFLEAWIRPFRFPTTNEGFFPIIAKKDSTTNNTHYSLRLLSSGRLQFNLTSQNGTLLTATSDTIETVFNPNTQSFDSTWSHVGVFVNLANGVGQSSVKFYIDGKVQDASNITTQLGSNVVVNTTNTFPTFIGYEPLTTTSGTVTTNSQVSFIGDLKGIRFWNGIPGGVSITGNEPTALTNFIRGAMVVTGNELLSAYRTNLVASFDMNGGALTSNGFSDNSLQSSITNSAGEQLKVLIQANNGLSYAAAYPFMKLVEPKLNQLVTNTRTDLLVRWVGFNYDRTSFNQGDNATQIASDLEWSNFSGGNVTNLPYNATASDKDVVTFTDAFTLPLTSTFRFDGVAPPHVQFAGRLNMAIANYNTTSGTQTNIPATLKNGRLRMKGRATINSAAAQEYTTFGFLRTESPVFTITPASNFTVRALLEGYHQGAATAFTGTLGTTFANNGMRIKLYNTLGGRPNAVVAEQVSQEGYQDSDPLGTNVRGTAGSRFGNIPYVLTNLADGSYWVLVEHQNHLPVLSRYVAPFSFAGDDLGTWAVESGWDFQGWNGTASNTLTSATTAAGSFFTAYGYSETDRTKSDYGATGLHYNDGQLTNNVSTNSLAAMVAGDVFRDGKINSADRVQVRLDAAGAGALRSDVTGDGIVNATDRNIVDRNNGKFFSLTDVLPSLYSQAPQFNGGAGLVANPLFAKFEGAANNKGEATARPKANTIQSSGNGFKYRVNAEAELSKDEQFVTMNVYITNQGDDFAFANTTFGLNYNPNLLEYVGLTGTENSPWSNNPSFGYVGSIYSGPTESAPNAIPDLRTIEIDYDFFNKKSGVLVPNTKTLVGTLVFKIKKESEEFSFKWNNSTVVWTVDGVNLTKDGYFVDPTPISTIKTAAISMPNGGESWKVGKVYNISWSKPSKDANVNIQYSLDNGTTWNTINEAPVDVKTLNYIWQVPNVNSSEVIVRVIDVESGLEIDRSDNIFSIVPPANFISKPSAKDPIYFGGAKGQIKWSVEDLSKVRFEFSADGQSGWTSVSSSVNATTGQVEWNIPAGINSKKAVVAMYNAETGDFIAASEPFKVLAGNLTITRPTTGEKLVANSTAKVTWNSTNVNNFDIQLSLDGGINWTTIQENVNALKRNFDWKVIDNVNTENAILRAIYNGDSELEYTRSSKFGIRTTTNVNSDVTALTVGVAYPNPFTTETAIDINLPSEGNVTVELYNAAGAHISTLVDAAQFARGLNYINIKGEGLTAGVYFVKINVGSETIVREVVLGK
jgi:hypothetical protein